MNDFGNGLFQGLKTIKASELGLVEFSTSILFSIAIGITCLILYKIYFGQSFDRNESLPRSFMLIAPSVTTIFWAIQYSLPLSLGLLGALSFVRFRTPVKSGEDIAFILMVIALSLLSSIYRFIAAIMFLVLIAIFILLKVFLLDKGKISIRNRRYLTLFVTTSSNDVEMADQEIRTQILESITFMNKNQIVLKDVIKKEGEYNLRYSLYFKNYNDNMLSRITNLCNKLNIISRTEVFNENF
ncbi:DUF4956 domain-containing protein [Prochlorococcus sp. AH-716-M09]|nr:DUF4956 domain-containing protein [Prochlorococcus sp. AH-716-M09]